MAAPNARPAIPGIGIYAHIVGWGMAVPDNIMTNDDMAAIVETSDEWIQSRTGIKERRIATERESAATLGYKAAQRALEVADILPVDIDLVIVATSTPEHIFPSTASLIQDWLGASQAGAFDLSAACSGFVYALNMGAQAIKSGSIQTALVIGSETMSRVLDWQDRSTCILFGDGAGAVVLQASEQEGGVLSSVLRSDGSGADLLAIPTSNVRELNGHKIQRMYMSGGEVFKFATRVVHDSIREASELAGVALDDIKLVIPHQANQRILMSAARKLKMDIDRFMSNVDKYGNTSAASIPIALCEAIEEGRINQDDHIVMVGFGGGLSWASMVVQWGVPEPGEQQGTRINRQRRRFMYFWARWRSRWNRWKRNVSQMIERIRPDRGRIFRLKRKVDREEELDD
jgi:3-oxoacyl-[acyl-carrier-protein] synthase-3